jgi:NADH dehydrogenase
VTADTGLDAVTGAFGYSGSAIASRLLAAGRRVRTLTGHPDRAPVGSPVAVAPMDFDDPIGLARDLAGVTTLYNTYWVRFAHGGNDHVAAVENSRTLFQAARRAGVERIVHVSITHPSIGSPYPYFRGKALVERALVETGVPAAILRPAILFGGDGVLLNNVAWLLRKLPAFAIAGDGIYRVRGIHVDDLAELAVGHGSTRTDVVVEAVGPDRPTFAELVGAIRHAVGSRSVVVHVPRAIVPPASWVVGRVVGDVLLTPDELGSMMDGLADTDGPATGDRSVLDWIAHHGDTLGRTYANELTRHFR